MVARDATAGRIPQVETALVHLWGELVGAKLSEFDFDEEVWTIPASRAKNSIAHRVPLSPSALVIM